jgi:type II secretory pathway pseudopilin PulG
VDIDERLATSTDDGFTLVEMVVALIIMFGALIASSQVIISMVKATLYSRHADYAVTIATQVMENAVTNDCGGRLPDNRTNPRARWESQRDRCKFFATTPTYSTLTPTDLCKSRSSTGVSTFFKGWDSGSLAASRNEADLGRRYLVSEQGKIAYCVSYDVQWIPLTWSAGSAYNNMRLQRTVRVQWIEPNRPDVVRDRVYTQVAALPPDAVQTSNTGRIDVYVGPPASPNDAPKSVTVELPPVSTRATGDTTNLLLMTLSADNNGWVHIPYLPTDFTTDPGGGAAVTVSPSFTVNVQIGGASQPVSLSGLSPNKCWALGSSAFVDATPFTFVGNTCS